jgi:hypothetical protein
VATLAEEDQHNSINSKQLVPKIQYFCTIMPENKKDYSFWTKYKRFAGTEIMLYVIMVIGIVLGIVIISYL